MLYRELLRIYCYTVAMLPLKINPVLPLLLLVSPLLSTPVSTNKTKQSQ